jgi:hypothetical protein
MNFQQFKTTFNSAQYRRYRVVMHLNDLAGGVPASPHMIEGWINATNKKASEAERAKLRDATLAELPDVADEKAARSWCRFKSDSKGPYIEGRCIKAALKEAGNVIKSTVRVSDRKGGTKPMTALKSKIAECVFIEEHVIHLCHHDGSLMPVDLPQSERPVHAMTAQGPRTSIKRTDIATDVRIEFTVAVLKAGPVTEEALYACLAYVEKGGIGSDRSQGRGTGEVVSVERLEEPQS